MLDPDTGDGEGGVGEKKNKSAVFKREQSDLLSSESPWGWK